MQPVFFDFKETFPTAVAAIVHLSDVQCFLISMFKASRSLNFNPVIFEYTSL